jgi:hypothetical protein
MKRFILLPTLVLLFYTAGAQSVPSASDVDYCITDDSLLTLVQYKTFQYFWEGAEPTSGMARIRYHVDGYYNMNDKDVVTMGGSGFGLMAIIIGIERGFISREQALQRLEKILDFLETADRFHGMWPHWLYGKDGKTKPFSKYDNGADAVESAYMFTGLLTVRQYFREGNQREKDLCSRIDRLWHEAEWNWFRKDNENVLYWHWSPDFGWKMNLKVRGYNECLIYYVLAAASPTYPIDGEPYHQGWARNGTMDTTVVSYGHCFPVKFNSAVDYGGPLFWAHFSYLALDPRGLKDRYADYWQLNRNQTLINREWCIQNGDSLNGYNQDNWGLSAGYTRKPDGGVGYKSHKPGRETGVITPSAAISSIPYTPDHSLHFMRYLYLNYGDRMLGKYGFYDAYAPGYDWVAERYLAVNQGAEIVMIENYHSGLIWDLFMSCPEIQEGLDKLGFEYNVVKNEK